MECSKKIRTSEVGIVWSIWRRGRIKNKEEWSAKASAINCNSIIIIMIYLKNSLGCVIKIKSIVFNQSIISALIVVVLTSLIP
jgi:hypothetical protein